MAKLQKMKKTPPKSKTYTFDFGELGGLVIETNMPKDVARKIAWEFISEEDDDTESSVYLGVKNKIHYEVKLFGPKHYNNVETEARRAKAEIFNDIDFNIYMLFKNKEDMEEVIGNNNFKDIKKRSFTVDTI